MSGSETPNSFRISVGSALFLIAMLGSAGVTMFRMVVAASFLPVADFGAYATIAATGAFLSSILSFGAIESTIKNFPRLVGTGDGNRLLPEAHFIMKRLVLRASVVGIPAYLVGFALNIEWLRLSGLGFFFALSTAYTLILASMQRASGSSTTLAAGTLLRSGSVFVAVSLAAYFGNLTVVLITEITITILACLASEWLYFRRKSNLASELINPKEDVPQRAIIADNGMRVFFAYTMISAPFYLDRLVVTSSMGREDGARYAVLALFLTAASLISNTLAQRSGPEAIRLVQATQDNRLATKLIFKWVAASSAIWLTAIFMAAAIIAAGLLPASLERYAIEPRFLIPVAVSGVLLNSGLIEFLLIALDRERQMLQAAVSFALTVLIAALIVDLRHWGVLEFIWMLTGCRMIYMLLLVAALPLRSDSATGT